MRSILPEPRKLIQCEVDTVRRIKNNPTFWKNLSQLANDASIYLERNYTAIKKGTLRRFSFESLISGLTINGKPGDAHLGALIEANGGEYEQLTYFFALCDSEQLIRKFHFDFTPKAANKRADHPVFHLQYPGKLSAHLLSLNLKHEHLVPELSEPRISYTPMSLALTINLILREFPDERTHNVIEDRAWRELIKTNESNLLAPYFKRCNDFFLNRSAALLLFTNDFYYGQQ